MDTNIAEASGESRYRRFSGPLGTFITILASVSCLFCLLYAAGFFSYFEIYFFGIQFNAIFLTCVLVLIFLLIPARKGKIECKLPWYDILLIAATLAGGLYISVNALALAEAIKLSADPLEVVLGLLTLAVILEGVRRSLGWPMVIISLFFFLYIKFGYLIPGAFGSYPETWGTAVAGIYLSTQGIFGSILSLASGVVVVFTVFGIFYTRAGGGDFLMNMALSLLGSMRGGPAKTAVLGSALFGTVSGSPVANVIVTGTVTIPMMKRVGYEPAFAGAVESVASTGGSIMPPVMGVVAFVMATMINVPYATIALAAVLPALLYYFAVFVQVDLHAAKLGIRGLPKSELPSMRTELRNSWELSLPLLLLVLLIFVLRWPLEMSGVYTIISVVVLAMLRKRHRLGLSDIVQCLESGFRSALAVSVLMALAGVILAALVVTGLGPRISAGLVALAGNSLLWLVLLTGVVCYIMGMGVAIVGSYILLAALVGPSIEAFGVPAMAAHFFILYMITSGFFTPPLCPAAFVAASIADASPFRIGFIAMRLGIVAFLVPFIIIYSPPLILIGSPAEIAVAAITAFIAVFALAVGFEGYLLSKVRWHHRALLIGGGILIVVPGLLSDLIGLALITATLLQYCYQASRARSLILDTKQPSP